MRYAVGFLSGAPGANRTHDPQLRRLLLYPTELRARCIRLLKKASNFVLRLKKILNVAQRLRLQFFLGAAALDAFLSNQFPGSSRFVTFHVGSCIS
jgi:hypothetical protein